MKIAGIIAEYNPFHTGHAYHIQKTRELTGADYVIVVMSGDFVQRGAPALYSKHLRARTALLGGADLVLELPSTHACQSAEIFAQSAVHLLHSLGCVDILSFGSESGQLDPFIKLGSLLSDEPAEYQAILKQHLKSGNSFPKARSLALQELLQDEKNSLDLFLQTPNNILGVEYCKALCREQSMIQPFTIRREGSGYHATDLENSYPSASAIRSFWKSPDLTEWNWENLSHSFPKKVSAFLQQTFPTPQFLDEEDFSVYLRWMLFSSDPETFICFQDVTPDFTRRLLHARTAYENWHQFVSLLKTRELTYSRISRMLIHCLLQITPISPLSYARLLGFRRQASPVLASIKKNSCIPLITKTADAPHLLNPASLSQFAKNIQLSNLYETIWCEKYHRPFVHEYQKSLIILP